ncbi:hypothetical protein [Gorillibacterium massiliense]|uniref:hypothetical protein n=1 Tax=Gorillibacterium massiliense TaxID=1280390 RepID=UPI0005928896|nr:hypothetical protein [Gorillibacterium massiliense]
MKYKALIKATDPNIEEEVKIEINGVELIGFVDSFPYGINIGGYYPVEIGITVLDDLELKEIDRPAKEIEQIEEGFGYFIRGELDGDRLYSAIIFQDDEWFQEYCYLTGKYVEIVIDRISIEFLEED